MKRLLSCRRTFLAAFGIACLTFLGHEMKSTDVALAIAGIVTALCGANAYEGAKRQEPVAP